MDINFFNPRSVILFVCILQGLIFALLLFWRSRQKRTLADFWLGVLLIVMCSSLVTHFVGFAGVYDANQNLTFFPFETVFAHAPVIYLYVNSLTNAKRGFRSRDLLLFIPTFIYLVYRFTLFWQDLSFKDWYNANIQSVYVAPLQTILLFVWNLALLYFSIKHYRQYRSWLNDNFSDTELVKFNWLRNFLYLFVFAFLCNAAFEFTDTFLFSLSFYQFYYLNLRVCKEDANPFVLNFASAKNPGGGFLSGAQAQEESLARSSALYPCLTANFEMYESMVRTELR